MRNLLFVLAAAAAVSVACATTKTTSMVAPEHRGRAFMRVLVIADLQDLEMMQLAERAVRAQPTNTPSTLPDTIICDPICRKNDSSVVRESDSTVFIPAHTVLFPGRTYAPDELKRILREHRVDATLVLSPTAAGVSETYVPPTFVTNCTTWSSTTSCSSRAVGGGTLKSPWASFAARLYDATTGKVVWIATSNTNGSIWGTVVVLVGEYTQGAAEYDAMAFRSAPNAIVVGSTTAGSVGDISLIPLPGSLVTWMSGIGVYYPNGTPTQRVGIVPDFEVRPTVAGIRAGRDEVLEAGIARGFAAGVSARAP